MAYEKLELLIDGEFRAGSQGVSEPVYNPATGEVLAEVPHASSDDLDKALAANARVSKEWAQKTPLERQKVIEAAGVLLWVCLLVNFPSEQDGWRGGCAQSVIGGWPAWT